MSPGAKNTLVLVGLLFAILAAGVSVYFTTRKPANPLKTSIHQAIGEALAEETIKAVGQGGKIVLVTLEKGESPDLDQQLDAFKDRIYDFAIKIERTDTISSDKSSKFGPGAGMSGKRFVRIMEKYQDTGAVVSFVGTPDGEDEELKDLKKIRDHLPKVVAFTRAPDDIDELFEDKLISAAIVPRFQFPAPGPEKPKTRQELFDRYYQVVRADTAMP
ncbi:MAG: hypothetical protein L0Y58_18860 [Verrucomicrobia subdivision 3 bacterium]|nr:hypothetical protein [Limisphaerales bacterium]